MFQINLQLAVFNMKKKTNWELSCSTDKNIGSKMKNAELDAVKMFEEACV